MPKKLGHFCWHISAFSMKMLVLAFAVFAILASAFIWRISSDPLDISFTKNYIESVLHDEATGNYARMDRVVLYWPKLTGPLYLQLYGGELVNKAGATIISVDVAAISFSRTALLMGRILPKAIILKKPTLRLVRNELGEFEIDLGQEDADTDSTEQFALTTRIFNYIARPGRQSKSHSLLSRLEAFGIDNASLFIDDKLVKQSWSLPDFNLGFYSTTKGMKGYIALKLPDVGLEKSELHVDLKYIWDQKHVELSADLQNIDINAVVGKVPELGALGDQNIVLDAHIETILDENFIPEDINIVMKSDNGEIFYPDLSEEAVPYSNLALSASYNYAGKTFMLRDTQVTVRDVTVRAHAELIHDDDTAKGSAKISIDSLKQAQIAPLWPKVLRGDNSEKWVVKKLSKGAFKDVWLGFDILAEKKLFQDKNAKFIGPFRPLWNADIDNLEAGFAFDNMSVNYRAPLDQVTKASGTGSFNLNKDELRINISKAKLGKLNVSKGKLLFDQITAKGKGDADIAVNLTGGVQDFMRYLSKDPINLDDDMKMDIDKVKGNAALDVSLKFPARKDVGIDEFKIGINGNLSDILLPDVIKQMDLSGKSLSFTVENGLASIKGSATLENRPMDFAWETFINSKGKAYKEKIAAKITADPNIRKMLGIDLSDFIEGSLPVDVSYVSYVDGSSKADVIIDVTPALFFVEPFDFVKPAGEVASAKLIAHLKNGDIQKITDLSAKGKGFKLFKSEISFKNIGDEALISKGEVSHFILGETKGKLEFVYDAKRSVNIILDADFLDAQPFMASKDDNGDYDAPPMRVSVTATHMRSAPNEVIRDAKLFFDIDNQGRFNQMEMNAVVGQGDLRVRFKPDKEGKRTFRLKADDAGAFLKAFQVYSDIRGGTLVIYGEPMRGVFDRNLRGKAEISNFKVVNAPFLSKLLSILSLGGVAEVMSGDGLNFEKLEADFNWLFRRGGSLLVLKNGRTSGNSLGLLFDGTFDNQKREVDVSGTIVPMSALNEVIGAIPIIGDILTGGSGGVFAATYSIKGKSDDPEISVNPLSILTPGILRRILWE